TLKAHSVSDLFIILPAGIIWNKLHLLIKNHYYYEEVFITCDSDSDRFAIRFCAKPGDVHGKLQLEQLQFHPQSAECLDA
ncbi:MAG: hypothetical protein J6T56_05760, partial [Bacteroidales bacterium]|nr:hypothetical protein [Bacteroidales bacterium]